MICINMGKKKNSKNDNAKRYKAELATEEALGRGAEGLFLDADWEMAVGALQSHLEWIDQLLIEKRNTREDVRSLLVHMESNILKDKVGIELLRSILTRLES